MELYMCIHDDLVAVTYLNTQFKNLFTHVMGRFQSFHHTDQ